MLWLAPAQYLWHFSQELYLVVTISDCTHRSLFEAYPAYKNLCRATRRHGDKIERAAMKRASASIFASDWAADSAIRDYDAEPAKVHIVPFGANFECQPAHNDVVRSIQSREFNKLRLLFIGVEWERKGGRIALDVVRKLIQLGIPAHLTVVGCEPAISAKDAQYVSVQGFIKKTVEGQKKINNFLSQSHFLIVPSEAECYGLVFCEASAFGVPSIARNVGGVGTIIKSDVNGRLFDYHTTAKDMVDWIISFYREPEKYHRLALLTLAEYESRLNWESLRKNKENFKRRNQRCKESSQDIKNIGSKAIMSEIIKNVRLFYLAWIAPTESGGACLAMRRHLIEHDDFELFVATVPTSVNSQFANKAPPRLDPSFQY